MSGGADAGEDECSPEGLRVCRGSAVVPVVRVEASDAGLGQGKLDSSSNFRPEKTIFSRMQEMLGL